MFHNPYLDKLQGGPCYNPNMIFSIWTFDHTLPLSLFFFLSLLFLLEPPICSVLLKRNISPQPSLHACSEWGITVKSTVQIQHRWLLSLHDHPGRVNHGRALPWLHALQLPESVLFVCLLYVLDRLYCKLNCPLRDK